MDKIERRKKYREMHKEQERAYNKKYRDAHRDEINAKRRAEYFKIKEKKREYYAANKDHQDAVHKIYLQNNREKRAAYDRAYYLAHKEQNAAYYRDYYAKNREKLIAYNVNRKKMKRAEAIQNENKRN
jgi:hypothetical protein